MKNFVFSMVTLMVLGTTVCFGKTNKEVEKEAPQQQETVKDDIRHDAPRVVGNKKPEKKRRHGTPVTGMPVKKSEVTYSVQTLHF